MLTIDPHAHFLFGTDDGPETLDGALRMARLAAKDGVTTVYCTSHLDAEDDVAGILADRTAKRAELQAAADAEHLGVTFECGAEWMASAELPEKLAAFPEARFGGTDAFLFELSPYHPVAVLPLVVKATAAAGYRPMAAHPERYKQLSDEVRQTVLAEAVAAGAVLQLTAGSFTGLFGHWAEKAAWAILEAFPNDVVLASDAHESSVRVPGLSAAATLIEKRFPGMTDKMDRRLKAFLAF